MAAAEVAPVDPTEGPVILGSLVLLLAGALSVILGIAALSDSGALADSPELIVAGSDTWGTALVILGIAAGLVAFSLWFGAGARWIAVALAATNAMVQVLFIPAYPFGALAIFALDVLTIFALVVLVARARGKAPVTVRKETP